MKAPDKRCCGSGVCIINQVGECWCGQVWDGEKMSAPPPISASDNSSYSPLKPEKNCPE
ncbi:MAG: hypothetical protein ACOYB0_01140 [Polynucleobacter sp.]